jgi:hypothetical protein
MSIARDALKEVSANGKFIRTSRFVCFAVMCVVYVCMCSTCVIVLEAFDTGQNRLPLTSLLSSCMFVCDPACLLALFVFVVLVFFFPFFRPFFFFFFFSGVPQCVS